MLSADAALALDAIREVDPATVGHIVARLGGDDWERAADALDELEASGLIACSGRVGPNSYGYSLTQRGVAS